ncbi:MAG: hypothetical protein ABR564_08675 [Candidatus Dormibacteria bacterium]
MGVSVLGLDDVQLFNYWIIGVLLAAIAIIVVVWLIWGITRSALNIDELADEIIGIANRIEANTKPLFALEKTANLGEELVRSVTTIEEDAGAVLTRAAAGPGSRRTR